MPYRLAPKLTLSFTRDENVEALAAFKVADRFRLAHPGTRNTPLMTTPKGYRFEVELRNAVDLVALTVDLNALTQPTVESFVSALRENCERYHTGTITREAWDRIQGELWTAVNAAGLQGAVTELLTPNPDTAEARS